MVKSRYIITTLLPKEVSKYHQEIVSNISEKFNLKKTNTPTHITLKDSFYTDDTSKVEEVITKVSENTQNLNPKISINGIGNFRNEIYFLKVSLNKDAFSIHKQLIQNLKNVKGLEWDEFDVIDRNFHISITTKADESNYRKIEECLEQYNPTFKVSFDNISILRKLEKEKKWMVYRRKISRL